MKNISKKKTAMITGLVFIFGVVIFSGGYFFSRPTDTVNAADASNWRAGEIADDGIFFNGGDLTVSQIQQFIDQRVNASGGCDTNGTRPSELGGGTRAQYGTAHGYPPPYVCLNGYYENPTTHANNLSTNVVPDGAVSAAQLIENASTTYNVSAKALIVMIEKESPGPLLDDTWPFPRQYTNAMGFGCPDTAPCDPQYAGFANQIMNAARQFKLYANNPASYRYKANQTNAILYSPAAGCASSPVFISNQTTAGLYNYTPYQPNQAALNNMYGTGDGCSAYGNRNFWRLFTDWFSTTYADGYSARFIAQSPLNEPFYPGEPKSIYIQYKNIGSARWYDDTTVPTGSSPIHLAASVPTNRQSVFSYGWPSNGRPNVTFSKVYEADGVTLAANQHVVEVGQIATFTFNITPPWNVDLGVHREYFQPVLEGASNWSMGGVAWLDIDVESRYSATNYTQSIYPTIKRNSDVVDNFIMYKNSGSAAWYDTTSVPAGYYPTQLVTASPLGRASKLAVGWQTKQIAATVFSAVYEANGTTLASNQHVVMPGQIGKFSFKLGAGANVTDSVVPESFQPVIAGSPYPLMGGFSRMDAAIADTTSAVQFAGQSTMPAISRGQGAPVYFQYKNVGTSRWYDDTSVPQGFSPVHLAASGPTNRRSVFSYGWPSDGRPNVTFSKVYEADGVTLAANQHVVEVGQIARFEFTITAPWNVDPGVHRERFQPVLENADMWSMGGLSWFDITVKP